MSDDSFPLGSLLGWAGRKGYWLGSDNPRRKRSWRHDLFPLASIRQSKRSRKRKRRKNRPYKVITHYGRYRETVPLLATGFMGDKKNKKLMSGDIVGTKKFYTNGVVTSTDPRHLTGTPLDSEARAMTWDQINPGPPYLTGGPFASVKYMIPNATVKGYGVYSNYGKPGVLFQNRTEYDGGFVDDGVWGDDSPSYYHTATPPSPPIGYDTLAWDKLKPRIQKVNVAQFIYEIKDIPHMLETTANLLHNSWRSFGGGYSSVIMSPKHAADNFLNSEFGWLPFLTDYVGILDTFHSCQRHIRQLVRDNGNWVRKKSVLEEQTSHTLVYSSPSSLTLPSGSVMDELCQGYWDGSRWRYGRTEIWREETSRVWAVGSFKYYRPEFDDRDPAFSGQLMNLRRLLTLYGARINPTVLYKITPWTWAVDWFTRFGDFISHHDEFVNDGIVSKYLYIMRSYTRRVTKTATRYFYSGPCTLQWQRLYASKLRKVADSPYGFDRPWNQLTLRQIAILGSIGISRRDTGFIARGT